VGVASGIFDGLLADVRVALRGLRRTPGFTAVAIGSLALGIGANTGVFSVINAIRLRSLPVRHPEELRVLLWNGQAAGLHNISGGMRSVPGQGTLANAFPYPGYLTLRHGASHYADLFAFKPLYDATIIVPDNATTAHGLMVSGNFFATYGAEGTPGRVLEPADDRVGAEPVVVITARLRHRLYGAEPNVAGKTIRLNGFPFRIRGALPESFVGPMAGDPTDFYVPMAAQPQLMPGRPLASPDHWWVQIMGRLRPRADEGQLRASLDVLFRQVVAASDSPMERPGVIVEDGRRGPLWSRDALVAPLWVLLAVVAVVLLITCANLAGLLLARGAARRHDMAVRTALGALPFQLLRQSLVESLLLCLMGAALGGLLAVWAPSTIFRSLPWISEGMRVGPALDTAVLGFTGLIAVLAALLSGLLPALRAASRAPILALQQHPTWALPGFRLGKGLVVTQLALTLPLAVGAASLVRSYVQQAYADPGFDAGNVLVFQARIDPLRPPATDPSAFFESIREDVARLPGIETASLVDTPPFAGRITGSMFSVRDVTGRDWRVEYADWVAVSDGFFDTLGIPLVLGTDLPPFEAPSSAASIVVNEAFVHEILGNGPPLGRVVRASSTDFRIVGVCGDTITGPDGGARPTVYLSHRDGDRGTIQVAARTVLPPAAAATLVRRSLAHQSSLLPVAESHTLAEAVRRSLAQPRSQAMLLASLAGLATLLVCIGIGGLMSYVVTRRTREVGLRMALGATRGKVARRILGEVAWLWGIGVAAGVPLALTANRILSSRLYGSQSPTAAVVVAALVFFLVVVLFAAWLPARRASRVDPAEVLRWE